MDGGHRWNHLNFAVPPERLELVTACLEALFPWEKFVDKPTLVGYRLGADLHAGALYLRPTPAAAALVAEIARLRTADRGFVGALAALDALDADWTPHVGFMVPTIAEWEARVGGARRVARERLELEVRVVDVLRPGDGRAQTADLHQAFIRLGLLGPLGTTVEMQARG
ncbi:MAG TPA: hypothetical protein VKW76_08565 [Candidatus Binatia bacterium]|nr:hypothetical protein [Candidatus Binatia bacterium]